MCNYQYTPDYTHLPRLMGKECPYTKIYSELKHNGTYNFENVTSNLELPLDSHGICLFHSNELEWKRKNNFAIKFLELLQALAIYDSFEFQVGKLFRFVTSDDLTSEQKTEFLTVFNRLSESDITLETLDKDNLEVAIRKQCVGQPVVELEKPLRELCKELKGNHPLKAYKSLYDYGRRYYDFVEFVFVGEAPKSSKDSKDYIFNLTSCDLNKDANFTGALFVDGVEFDQIKFNGGATFQQARFKRALKMKTISFDGVDFAKASFEQTASFENVDFLNYALFPDSQFTYSSYADGYSFIFNNSRFHGVTDFSRVTVKSKDSNSSVAFKNVNFEDSVDFTDSIFDCTVSFRNVEFDAIVEFINTSFNTTKSTSRHREYAVEFIDIIVNEKGSLIFQSTDPQNKLFKQDVWFRFKKEIEGTIKFENANFNHIDDVSRRELLLLSKLGKVEIGSGCLKYRFQTEIRTILIDENNQSLILELTQTFINYFTVKNGFNLGFEILERDDSKISFFYFTDENITSSEFLDRLQETEQDLLNLTSGGFDEQLLLSDGKTEKNSSKENAIINAVDSISALIGTFFRVGIRIATGKWSQKDTKALLNAVHFNNHPLLDATNLHQVLLDKYTAKDLILMRDRQNSKLLLSTMNVFLDQSRHISTDGGAFVQGNVNTGGDFIGRDQFEKPQS